MCTQCGEVYCSVKWMGNPGCFAKQHRKGNRRTHTKEPYTYMEELEAVRKKEERRKRRAETEVERQKQAEIEAAKAAQEAFEKAQGDREARILL
eukprot:CAMPEP_0182537250 /NCGR_PEP_ID=MMETSP1323-20130603/21587_1 /TAXON_ID=236787 /ORGANISM="Florenciella parvula, Strain RCC1693" /LENGTH=93 /DNA_ID=CAMNT_0024747601 /DNA_START=140 /DNA_END=417 /DNA_ORIENTATION=-